MGRAALTVRAASVLLLALAGSGCEFTMGRFAVATTRQLDAAALGAPAPGGPRVRGTGCTPIIVAFPRGPLPNVEHAVEAALAAHGATRLTDVRILYRIWYIPFLGGRVCYVAEGSAS